MTATPQITGYELDQRLLEHPLAEVWRGRSLTGMEIVALVLSEPGAADPQVRERLSRASRGAALSPEQHETPLWAANLTAVRPYAITQLVPGQSGAERLFDPLDGLLGNDEESLNAVRSQLAQYGAEPLPPAELSWTGPAQDGRPHRDAGSAAPRRSDGSGPSSPGWARRLDAQRRRLGAWAFVIVVVIVLAVFSLTYSLGAAIGSAVKDAKPITQGPVPELVSPGPLPSPALKPGIIKAKEAPYQRRVTRIALVGAVYEPGADVQVAEDIGLPFGVGWPRPPAVDDRGESSYAIYRRILTGQNAATAPLDARIAVHPCGELARCLTERATFDRTWTAYFKAPVPRAPKGDRTWLTVRPAGAEPYALTMTHAFSSEGRWWLAGVMVTGASGEEPAIQRVLNDIRTQAG